MATERYFSTDVLADILRRLPPSSRRRARLVCRHWRDVVNKRTTEMQSRAKPLVWKDGVAYVIADLSSESTGVCKELWRRKKLTTDWRTRRPIADEDRHSHLVGTCNGLICICNNEEQIGGSITVANPATGETLPVPPLPWARQFVGHHYMKTWHESYNFAYHPTTGKYKVLHVPCSYDRLCDFKTVQVFTLGETRWREVSAPAGGARCDVSAGIISADGTTHWVKADGDTRIMSFDLDAECFASAATSLPRLPDRRSSYRLTEVQGRLGVVILPNVWVLEEERGRYNVWSRRYRIHTGIPRPHFVFGDCILTRYSGFGFYVHEPKSTPRSNNWRLECKGVVQVGHLDYGTLVAKMTGPYDYSHNDCYQTFAYVETTEPLGVYAQEY